MAKPEQPLDLTWTWHRLSDLPAIVWHEVGCLRQAVFVVEQNCAYPDLDELDLISWHLLGQAEDGLVLAYLRLVPEGHKFAEPSIGRVVIAPEARGSGLGRKLLEEGLRQHSQLTPTAGNRIGAQTHLSDFYRSLGYLPTSDTYLEDGIPHLDMLWQPPLHP
ncbi:GNAT family N-acetyltransferase [Parachitinimonas caeni]|uniref:GNAT family N-acetyltransferase n=1 Tax=Parachitinimonas caeni TaxID=3031301 RepID=A0ABT7DY93_9NEIS|nr:GNAT family N-acetyltransferase [Parachitinimonas caeni]MDK2125015.1 GNAT family N-acetyltransferase [Parachitinimonas caeni]